MENNPPAPPIRPDLQLSGRAEQEIESSGRKRRQWLWILILLLIFAVIFYFIFRNGSSQKPAQAGGGGRRAGLGGPVTLTSATAKQGSIGVYLDAIGTVTPVYTASIYNQVTGVITAVHYREGQVVRKGEPLVDIDPRQFQANVDTAAGNLERDINVLAQSKMDVERYRTAWSRNAIAKQILDDEEKTVLQNEGLVKADQGTLDFDKVQLAYCHVVAPFTGKVGLRLVDPGNLVQGNSSTELVVLTQIDPMTVIFTLAEENLEQVLAQIHQGHTLSVEAWDQTQDQQLGTGKLMALDNQIDTTTGTVKLRALFDNKKNALFPNQFVNTRLLVKTEQNMTLIPTGAIQHNGDVAFVYVLANGAAKVQNVTPGTSDKGITAVQGIHPGDVVATSSFEKLVNGSKVNIVKTALPQKTSESNTP